MSQRLAACAAALALMAAVVFAGAPARAAEQDVRVSRRPITVVDGPHDDQKIALDTSYFVPSGGGRHPAVLLGHGFGGTKRDVAGEARTLARAGYAVLTWTARGFGTSEGQIGLDSPDYEVKDVKALVSWLAARPEVRLDGPGDPRVGVAGASYGGGIALMSAALDHRIDAIAPQITWNDLASALFPNAVVGSSPDQGVFKQMWAGLLFTSGTAGLGGGGGLPGAAGPVSEMARQMTGTCGRFRPEVCRVYDDVARTGKPTAGAVKLLRASSPASYAGKVRVPTLLIQGQNDSLFPLDQADANARMIARTGAPVQVVWGDGGHDAGGAPISDAVARTRAWFDRFLAPAHPAKTLDGPGFVVSRSGGVNSTRGEVVMRTADAARYPGLGGTGGRTIELSGGAQTITNPPGGSPASISALPGLSPLLGGGGGDSGSAGRIGSAAGLGVTLDIPGQAAVFESAPLSAPLRVTGAPTVRLRVSGADDIVAFVKLYDVGGGGRAELPNQLAAPIRVTGAKGGRTVTVRLPAIDHEFAAGDRLRLSVASTDMAYATPAAAASYTIATVGAGVAVPVDPALTDRQAGLPAWVWILPLVAVVAAIGITVSRRRGRHRAAVAENDPELADVPLAITGLTKGYARDRLAVDGLSMRVERGQVVGLLGPNGAGKTTALRLVMGLLFADRGEIRIFGRLVRPGAAVLSRLGSFVEGPGFLPHLSGRANLELYWRATGRPAGDAHLDDVLEIAALGDAVRRPVRTYSQGMRQRLAIAQAMLGFPDLLVLDEPTNGLDPPQIREMRDVLRGYARDGRAVIVSSHLLAEVEQTCTHVVVMRAGVGVAAGPVGEIVGHGATLVLGTPDPEAAKPVLRAAPGVVDVREGESGLVVRLDGEATTSEVLAELVAAGVPVDRAEPNRRLEDVFLSLIGDQEMTASAGPALTGSPEDGERR